VRHPTALDVTATGATQAWNAAVDAAARTHARLPAPLDETVLERSANLTGHMTDVQVAGERGIDVARYESIRDTIEIIITLHPDEAPCTNGAVCNVNAPASADDASRRQRAATLARDRRLLQPYAQEILALQAIVRDPTANATPRTSAPTATRKTSVLSTTRKSSSPHAPPASATRNDG
jgi:hypothetical protein